MPKVKNFRQTPNLAKLEEEILNFWKKDHTFEKSVENRSKDNAYVFYDGPPFATGMPHYGHLLSSTNKDVIPRYQTMKGKRVERVWGWDCHGLPIENMIEKKLDIKGGKKGIEDLGIDKFNQACRSEVLRLDKEWERIIGRLGRWVDFKNNYKTMDTTFMESVWWGFKQLYDQDLVYEGKKVILYCPRCATPLSNFEIAMDNSYKDDTDWSIYVKFKATNSKENKDEYLLAWTTTPWTLPGNVALAVDAKADYVQVEFQGALYWLAKKLLEDVFKQVTDDVQQLKVIKTVKGKELVGYEYQALFNYVDVREKKAHYVAAADFVSLEDGTGIVHTAAIFGEDDYNLALELDLPLMPTLDEEGKFYDFVTPFAGMFYKKAEKYVNQDLEKRGLMFFKGKITHSYPHCYRCDTPLFYYALPAWFVDVQKLKQNLIDQNEEINWYPHHLKHGRFKKGLEGAPDWNISRSRYWGTPMPVWVGKDKKGKKVIRVIGSIEELKKWAVDPKKLGVVTDLHREYLDDVEVWVDEAKTIKGKRIPEVFDCWVESGSMSFASIHYPFENQDFFKANYPADYVTEYIAQTRAWFYTMHVMSVGVFGKPPFKNVLTTGTILAEDGSKMSKSKKNYPDPMLLVDKYGVDSLRLYMMSSTVMKAENLNFSEKEVSDLRRKVFVIWWNVLSFYKTFADQNHNPAKFDKQPKHILDQWMISRINSLNRDIDRYMSKYDVVRASRTLISFINELSNWYLRLSRDRIKSADNSEVSHVLGYAIYSLAQLFAPFCPFFTELVHHNMIDDKGSIHLTDWPKFNKPLVNKGLEAEMCRLQQVVEIAHALRKEQAIKVRQPLASLTVDSQDKFEFAQSLAELLETELNVKTVVWQGEAKELRVSLDFNLTEELRSEGQAREIMRKIQNLRRKAGLEVGQAAEVQIPSWPKKWQKEIEEKTNSILTKGNEAKILK